MEQRPKSSLTRRNMLAASAGGFLFGTLAQMPGAAVARSVAPWARRLIDAGRGQIGVTVEYNGAYEALSFPGGDIPRERGVCTDVIIRAYRDAFDFDLQRAVNSDMRRNFSRYPKNWGLKRPDRNIDHRRVPNLQTFFRRHRGEVQGPRILAAFHPGDLITQMIGGRLPHIGIVSDRTSENARPLLIHNIGAGTQEEDVIASFPITGHYRFKPS